MEWATQPGNRAEPRVAMRSVRYLTARTAAALAVGGLYLWFAGLAGVNQRFAWNSGLDEYYGLRDHPAAEGSFGVEGYYDLLGRAFVAGHLRLPVEPSPKLLALPDPWSDKINRPYRLLDTVLYGGHYYLYHGPTPVLLLFAPWYGITRHDFPENFAVFLFSFAAYLFSAVLFTRVIGSLSIELPLWLYTLVVVVLGLCQSVPFLLHRAKVYEVAIACGYFCLSSGFYFLFRVLSDSRKNTFHAALAGLSFGLAVGCRPHLAAAAAGGLFALLVLRETPKTGIWRRILRPEVLAFTLPVVLCGLALAAYNFARFGNPFEFGIRYLLGEDAYRNFHFTGSLLRGFYYLLICPPDLVPEFPFVRMAMRPYAEYNLLPSGYFLEPIAGMLSLCPLLLLTPILFLPGLRQGIWKRGSAAVGVLTAMLICAMASILVIASVPFSSHRYEVDFGPYLLLIGCLITVVGLRTAQRRALRIVATAVAVCLILYSMAANLALGVQGPYDEFVQWKPQSYVEVARWFSPVERYRPLLNPVLLFRADFEFPACPAHKEPLVSLGEFGSRYLLSAQCPEPGHIVLISESSFRHLDARYADLPLTVPGHYEVGLKFSPADRIMTVTWNGRPVLQHPLRFLVTSRSQIRPGVDPTLGNPATFSGRIRPSPPLLIETGN